MFQRVGIFDFAADDPGEFDQLIVVSRGNFREADFLIAFLAGSAILG